MIGSRAFRYGRNLFVAFLLYFSSGTTEARAIFGMETSLQGRVISRRTQDSFEFPAPVANQAYFLFKTDDKPNMIIMLSYFHAGNSSFPDGFLNGKAKVEVHVKRKEQCDGTIGSYEASAPDVPVLDPDSGKPSESLPGLVWNENGITLPADYVLHCYSLIITPKDGVRVRP